MGYSSVFYFLCVKVQKMSVLNMEVDKETIKTSSYIFGYFLSLLLLKYSLYDNGFEFSNILLLIGLVYTRFHLFIKESDRLQEAACLVLCVLFDKSLLDIGNVFLLLGVACIREELRDDSIKKEIVSLVCGLIYLLMGWNSVGRILVIYSLLLFYFVTIGFFFGMFVYTPVLRDFSISWLKKMKGDTNTESDDTTTSNEKN